MAAVMTGYDDGELKQGNILSLLGPYFHLLVGELFTHLERYGEKTCSEVRLCTTGGVTKDVEVRIAKAMMSEGERKVYPYTRDITESKRIESDLREANEFFDPFFPCLAIDTLHVGEGDFQIPRANGTRHP
jgi:hypothetical protein